VNLSLSDKTLVVTGGSSGIGAGIARAAARAGARTVLVGRNQDRLDLVADEIGDIGGDCRALSIDLLQDDAPARVVAMALEEFGSIDVLVPAAGVFEPQPFDRTTLESFDRTWHLNVRVPFALAQAAAPHLDDGGVIVFVSSIDGHVGFASDSAYGPSKAAVDGLTRALSIELAKRGTRVVGVAPGFTETPMNEALRSDPAFVEKATAEIPAGRLATVEDIAAAVVFLASDAAGYTHGAILCVDGGYPASPLQQGME
jgi:NAD(P)-dependent dehydrogenase (short-subunit alcohol dehydrogenase family)